MGGWSERNVLYTKARTIRPETTPRALSVISLTAAKVVKAIGSDVRKFLRARNKRQLLRPSRNFERI